MTAKHLVLGLIAVAAAAVLLVLTINLALPAGPKYYPPAPVSVHADGVQGEIEEQNETTARERQELSRGR